MPSRFGSLTRIAFTRGCEDQVSSRCLTRDNNDAAPAIQLLLASNYPHIHFSGEGLLNADPALAILSYALHRGEQLVDYNSRTCMSMQ